MTVPKTKRERTPRKNIRLPKPMVDEIDRIVRNHVELHYNRQQFIESAIRDKIERIKLMEMGAKAKVQSSDE